MNNLKGNDNVNHFIEEEFNKNSLSSSLLFLGDPYTGKRLGALSLGKLYLKHNPIESPYFLSLGALPREEEWQTFYQLYLEKKIGYPFLKSFILYFMKKFNPIIWNIGDIKSKVDSQDLNTIQEILFESKEPSSKEWEKINQLILKVYSLYPKNISIGQIRSLKEWAFSLKGEVKIVFIEEASSLSPSAMNGLLKILEEPPEDFICILSANKRNELPSTLLSRLRSFTFTPYSQEETQKIIKENYEIRENISSLYDFFNASSLKEKDKIRSLAKDYYLSLQERSFFPDGLPWKEIFSIKEGKYKESLEFFLREILSFWKKEVSHYPNKTYFFQKLTLILNEEAQVAFLLNQNPISFLENLFYQLKKIYISEEDF